MKRGGFPGWGWWLHETFEEKTRQNTNRHKLHASCGHPRMCFKQKIGENVLYWAISQYSALPGFESGTTSVSWFLLFFFFEKIFWENLGSIIIMEGARRGRRGRNL